MNLEKLRPAARVDLRDYTTFRIGPVTDSFYQVNTVEELRFFCRRIQQPFYILGGGSNLLLDDSGLSRPVLQLGPGFAFCRETAPAGSLEAGAALALSSFLKFCLARGFSGLETHCGIPARLGGLVRMNASCYGTQICDRVRAVTVCDVQGSVFDLSRDDIDFFYRGSSLGDTVILSLRLSLEKKAVTKSDLARYFSRRCQSQDLAAYSCGCVFKNPPGQSAGALIDACGLKGMVRNDAVISSKHGNFIVNSGKASYNDVDYLINLIKEKVYQCYNILLEEEIQRWT